MKGIIGAIAGDIIGSVYEFHPIKTKEFSLFKKNSSFTDDTIMTLAVAQWLLNDKNSKEELVKQLQIFGHRYPKGGYGRMFNNWLRTENPEPYKSWGNGGALATADAIYLARLGSSKEEIRDHIEIRYDYDLSRTVDEIRPYYKFDVSCQGSVPESIICFLEAKDYEDTIRNCISLGGDADTMAAIAGGIASAYWEVPNDIHSKSINRLSDDLLDVLIEFENKFV